MEKKNFFDLSSTYEDVQENSDIHWKFQRYGLLSESKNFCYLPPPLNLFYYCVIKPIVALKRKCFKKSNFGDCKNLFLV